MDICDIESCSKKAIHTLEDMSDGEWVQVCGEHYRKLMLQGGFRDE